MGTRFLLRGNDNDLKLAVVVVAQLCESTRNYSIAYFT